MQIKDYFEEDYIPISKYILLYNGPFILELRDIGCTRDAEFNVEGIRLLHQMTKTHVLGLLIQIQDKPI